MKDMKKLTMAMAALLASSVCVAAVPMSSGSTTASKLKANKALISLADARSRIDKAVARPAVMKALMQHLSAADQKTFLSDVNAAIATMPASDAERVATYVAANRAALKGSQRGNVATLVAESFATVQPVALPALSESLGTDLLNRATDKNRTFTDAEYLHVCSNTMARVNARTAEVNNGEVRSGFAALALIRGSNTTKPEIVDPVVAMLPASAQDTAKKEWFPAALADGSAKSYDAMLAAADVEGYVSPESVEAAVAQKSEEDGEEEHNTNEDYWMAQGSTPVKLRVTGPQLAESIIFDVVGGNLDPSRTPSQAMPVYDALQTMESLPAFDHFHDVQYVLGELDRRGTLKKNPGEDDNGGGHEPHGYQWQDR